MKKETKIISSAQKCLQILKYMANVNEGLGLNELAEAMDINKSIMHHYLSTLLLEGFIIQNPNTKDYRIGPEAFKVGECYLRKDFPYDEMGKILRELHEKVNQSTYYFLRTDTKVSCILAKESPSRDSIHLDLGTAFPLHASASGKVFLAYITKAERDHILNQTGLSAYTEKTITDINLLEKEIIEVRLQGYALSDGEYGDFREIAVPVIGFGDKIVGALSVIGFIEKLSDSQIKEIVKHLTHYGHIMSDLVHNVVL